MIVRKLLFATIASFALLTKGYLLGETEGDPNFQRCWREGQLLVKCPQSLSISWDYSDYLNNNGKAIMYANRNYDLEVHVTWNQTELPAVPYLSKWLIQHMNVHSCIFSTGEPCAPHIAPATGSVSHSDVLMGNTSNETFLPHFRLTEGSWNIIAHARLYINDNDSSIYQIVGDSCDSSNTIATPWKLDFAIGTKQDILPEPIIDEDTTTSIAGWQIFVIVIGIVGFLAVCYKLYKYCKSNQMEDLNRLTPAEQVKKALLMECAQTIVSYGLGVFDFVTDVAALVDLQSYNKLDPILVAGYFAMVIIVSLFFFGCTYLTIKNLMAVAEDFKKGIAQVTVGDHSSKAATKGSLDTEYSKVKREIVEEKVSLIMGFTEDVPMFAFNLYIIFGLNVKGLVVMTSMVVNAIMIGYKISGLQRIWLSMQLKKKIDCSLYAIMLSASTSVNRKDTLSAIQTALLNGQVESEKGAESENDAPEEEPAEPTN